MRYSCLLSLCVLLLFSGCAAESSEEISMLKQEIAHLKSLSDPPPSSLNSLYPPQAGAPVYLERMFELSIPMAGVAMEVFEQNLEGARATFEVFKETYEDISRLVPEWEEQFPMEPVEALGRGLESGEQAQIMPALEHIEKVCYDCHLVNMTKVHQRYHWRDFSTVTVNDPVTGDETSLFQHMWNLERPFVGTMVELQKGRIENAVMNFDMFSARFQDLGDVCTACHDTERTYFVDESVQRLVRRVGTMLRASTPDMQAIGATIEQIGQESCFRCHLVHLPAAHNNIRWRVTADVPAD